MLISFKIDGCAFVGLAAIVTLGWLCASGQTAPYTLRVTTREVVVDVVAMDRHNNPVSDLRRSDFQIFEVSKRTPKSAAKISAFRVVDPALENDQTDTASHGFRVTLGGGCAMSATFHYQLSYQPASEGWTSGYHEILVTTSRPHVTLSFHRRYYVGETNAPEKAKVRRGAEADAELAHAACYRLTAPSSIPLAGHLIQTANTDPLRYSLVAKGDSLAFTSLSDQMRGVQLDYGICTFDAEGKPLRYLHTSAERVLNPQEYEQVQNQGFPSLLELPRQGAPAFARIVVRDRETGNLGSIDVVTVPPAPIDLTKDQKEAAAKQEAKRVKDASAGRASESPGSFGSIVPRPGSLCGDVYEIAEGTKMLPDFWNYENTFLGSGTSMDPIGALHTYSLNVQYGFLAGGLPGVTSRPEWFGIDYYGEFWVKVPGEYRFKMTADDGAKLYIDGHLLIDVDGVHTPLQGEHATKLAVGRHTIHLPYFQGTVHVALILQVKPHGGDFKVFDLQEFAPPAVAPGVVGGG